MAAENRPAPFAAAVSDRRGAQAATGRRDAMPVASRRCGVEPIRDSAVLREMPTSSIVRRASASAGGLEAGVHVARAVVDPGKQMEVKIDVGHLTGSIGARGRHPVTLL
jgi:hypothetical protein